MIILTRECRSEVPAAKAGAGRGDSMHRKSRNVQNLVGGALRAIDRPGLDICIGMLYYSRS